MNRKKKYLFLTAILALALVGVGLLRHLRQNNKPEMGFYSSYSEEPVDIAATRAFLDKIGLNVSLPHFSITHQTFQYEGSDSIEDKWVITFTQALSDSFIAALDSLCVSDSSRWRHTTKHIGHGMASDDIPCYEFTFRNPDDARKNESIAIFRQAAELSYLKI